MYLTDILIFSQKYVQILSDIAIIKSSVLTKGIYKNMINIRVNLRVNQDIT